VNDTQLHSSLRKDRFNGIGKTRKPVHASNEDIL